MNLLNSLKNILTKKPQNATGFLEKFIRDSKKERVQLEIIRDKEILIQVDSLTFAPSWFKIFEVNEKEFKNGFVIFFVIDQNGIEKNEKYLRYKKTKLKLMEVDEMLDNTPIRTFAKFLEMTEDPVILGKEIKTIIDGIFYSK